MDKIVAFMFWLFVLSVAAGMGLIGIGVYQERGNIFHPWRRGLPGPGIFPIMTAVFPLAAAWLVTVFLALGWAVRLLPFDRRRLWREIVVAAYMLLGAAVIVIFIFRIRW